ncbi:DUF2303 family protein [Pasteurella testudinis]|nr:DUF2303 family protein [Pasteurella testudinis]
MARIDDFVRYVKDYAEPKTPCFISPNNLSVQIVFDAGTPDNPCKPTHYAKMELEMEPEHEALFSVVNTRQLTQADVINFIEDNVHCITPMVNESAVDPLQALAAFRSLTINEAQSTTSELHDQAQSVSLLSGVEAASKKAHPLPTSLVFTYTPALGLQPQTIPLRVIVTADNGKAAIKLRPVQWSQHMKRITDDFESVLKAALDDSVTLYVADLN